MVPAPRIAPLKPGDRDAEERPAAAFLERAEVRDRLAELHDQLATAKLAESPGASKAQLVPLQAENEFLQKPFTMDALLYKVRAVLDKNKKTAAS